MQTPAETDLPTLTVMGEEPDFAAEYASGFSASHGGRPPARSLVAGMASEARTLREEGQAASELLAAVRRSAEVNIGARLLPIVLAEIQSGPAGRGAG